jgi:hypothetical protein
MVLLGNVELKFSEEAAPIFKILQTGHDCGEIEIAGQEPESWWVI